MSECLKEFGKFNSFKLPGSPVLNRRTPSSQFVLDALKELEHPSAQDIVDWIRDKHPNTKRGGSLTSVYRSLNALVEQGELKPINFNDGHVRYEPISQNRDHHHHFICVRCNAVALLNTCPLEPFIKQLTPDFKVLYHNLEIFGHCTACQSKAQ